jgi:carboxyl-terminal processing protease
MFRKLFQGGMAALCLAATTTAAFAQAITPQEKDAVLKGVEETLTQRAFVPGADLKKWADFLAKHKEAIDKAEDHNSFATSVNRALREFGFSHVRLQTPRAAQARNSTTAVGVGFGARPEKDGLVVTTVLPKSSAEEAGIKPGHKIVAVDGKPADSPTVLSGDKDTEVTVKVKDEKGEEREVKLKRQEFSTVRKETLTWANDDTAVLRVFTFSRGYDAKNIENLIAEANEKKAKNLILDLRSNGGGATNNLQHLLSLLLPGDTVIGTFISRVAATRYAEAKGTTVADPIEIAKWYDRKYRTSKRTVSFDGKVAVLINRGSASASEICAAALRENAKAPIVGSRTAGAVLASIFGRLPHGYQIQYPVSDFVTAGGIRLEGNPVRPDAEITARSDGDGDPAIDKAIELLKAR